jgi:DNA repair protein RadA/Sms
MVLAVLQRKAGLPLSTKDVYASTVGGARVDEPPSDLALAVAVASAALDRNFPAKVIALGEVGLAGDLRRVPGLERRLQEASRLGFTTAVVPIPGKGERLDIPSTMRVVQAATLHEALASLDLRPRRGGETAG